MTIWWVIYFRHYNIMTQCHLICSSLVVVFNTPTHCYIADLRIVHNIHVVVAEGLSRRSELHNPAIRIFARGWNKFHDQNVYNPLRVYQVFFFFANALIVKLFFLKLIFPFLGIIFIFQAFVFCGSIPYGKIIPLYLNRVVRLTPLHIITIAKIDSWTLGKSSRMQSRPTSACLKSCFAKWRLGNAATI